MWNICDTILMKTESNAFTIWPAGCWLFLDINLFPLLLLGCRSRALCRKYFSRQDHLALSIFFTTIIIVTIIVITVIDVIIAIFTVIIIIIIVIVIIIIVIIVINAIVIINSSIGSEMICLTGAVGFERRDKVVRIANCLLRRSEQASAVQCRPLQ